MGSDSIIDLIAASLVTLFSLTNIKTWLQTVHIYDQKKIKAVL